MKKLLATLLSLLALTFSVAGRAATVIGNFNVTLTLNSTCQLTTPGNMALSYTSFQTAASPSVLSNFTVSCTNGLPYALSLDAATAGAPVTVNDVTLGLAYSLSLVDNANAAVPTTANGIVGVGAAQTFKVKGDVAGNQGAGNCTVASCSTTTTHTVTVTY